MHVHTLAEVPFTQEWEGFLFKYETIHQINSESGQWTLPVVIETKYVVKY